MTVNLDPISPSYSQTFLDTTSDSVSSTESIHLAPMLITPIALVAITATASCFLYCYKQKILEQAVSKKYYQLAKLAIFAGANPNPLLRNVCEKQDFQSLKFLLKNGPRIENRQSGLYFLEAACDNQDIQIIELLLAKGVNVNNQEGFSLLEKACRKGNEKIVELLLENGVDPNTRFPEGRTLLHEDSVINHPKCLKLLLKYVENQEIKDSLGRTPIFYAAFLGNIEALKLLLEANAEINPKENQEQTPLHFAAFVGHTKMTEFLIEKGAKFIFDNKGFSPIKSAYAFGHFKTVESLLKQVDINFREGDKTTPLHWACKIGSLSSVKHFLEEKYESFLVNQLTEKKEFYSDKTKYINLTDKKLNTPLHFAAEKGNVELVQYLIEEGAEFTLNREGFSPIRSAYESGHFKTVESLLKQVDINFREGDKTTPLHWACKIGSLSMVEHFHKYTKHFFRTKINRFVINQQIGKKAFYTRISIDDTDENLNTPLHFATEIGNLEIVKFLIENGAKGDIFNKQGKTPLKIADEKLTEAKNSLETHPEEHNKYQELVNQYTQIFQLLPIPSINQNQSLL